MKQRLFASLASLALSLHSFAQDTPPHPPNDEGMPVIAEEDRQLILQGVWWDMNPTVLPDLQEMAESEKAAAQLATTVEQQENIVDPFPENDETINERFLPEYITLAPQKLIDPQRLLNEVEKDDVIKLVAALETKYNVKIYVSLFVPGQTVPPEVNATTLARQIFNQTDRSMLLHAHYGDVPSFQIACDSKWMDHMGDNGRRALLAKIKESASVYTYPQDSLMEGIAAMALFAQPEMEHMLKIEKEAAAAAEATNVPDVNMAFTEEEKAKREPVGAHLKQYLLGLKEYWLEALVFLALLGGAVAVYMWRRNLRPLKLLASVPDRRLGAPHGASVSGLNSYGDKEDTDPESIKRMQMREHMKSISDR